MAKVKYFQKKDEYTIWFKIHCEKNSMSFSLYFNKITYYTIIVGTKKL